LNDLSSLYDADYFIYHRDEASIQQSVLNQIRHLVYPASNHAAGKRLIELGSAQGHLLNALMQIGYEVQGLEISAAAVAESKSRYSLPVFAGTAEEYLKAGNLGTFDIVVACTVIEHVAEPDAFINAGFLLLKPGGIFALDTPNSSSYNALLAGPAWELYQKYHVYLFDPTTITLLLEKRGFEVIQIFSYDNFPLSADEPRRLRRVRAMLQFLDAVGLYTFMRSVYHKVKRYSNGLHNGVQNLNEAKVAGLEPYESTRDAHAPLAAGRRGDHIAVIARKT
jgi:SAM-dependent methyltransferase